MVKTVLSSCAAAFLLWLVFFFHQPAEGSLFLNKIHKDFRVQKECFLCGRVLKEVFLRLETFPAL